jgi:hypothetical protein
MTELQLLLESIAEDLGDPTEWRAPVEFYDSLALCALNSAYSLRATSASATRVLGRYRAASTTADTDSGPDLLHAMDDAGGPVEFARTVLCNDSKLPGTRRVRTEGIHEALTRLAALDRPVETTEQLRTVAAGDSSLAERAWRSVSGLGPLSWSYLLMNAGVGTETKPDVMVQRYVAKALGEGSNPTLARTRQLLELAASELGIEPRALDRAIWVFESPSISDGVSQITAAGN